MNNLNQHEHFAQMSRGISDNSIHDAILENLLGLSHFKKASILDVGCGEGHLLSRISLHVEKQNLTGMDIHQYNENFEFSFLKHNLNETTDYLTHRFDIILATEVIEHIENPRFFLREMCRLLNKNGILIISTPNLYSLLSLLSFSLKGYHSSFGPKNYPAHITPISEWDLKNMAREIHGLNYIKTHFIANGRVPGSKIKWKTIFPFLTGKRFSDNYICLFSKDT